MGVKTAIAGVTPIAASVTQAETLGIDLPGTLLLAQLKCQELSKLMTDLKTEVFTPASDSTAASTMTTEITAMA